MIAVGGTAFGSRVHELREAGWEIEAEKVRGGIWRYRALTTSGTTPARHALTKDGLGTLFQTLKIIDDLFPHATEEVIDHLPVQWQDELFSKEAVKRLQR